jgi:SAM-dependent methyltransferase
MALRQLPEDLQPIASLSMGKKVMARQGKAMLAKPKHLGPDYAAQFKDQSIVDAYQYRPPYPQEVFLILAGLVKETPRVVLDVGCGTGYIARHLVNYVDRVDAVDFSQAMIETGKKLPGGDHPHLNWIHGAVEEVPFMPPYGLVTAAQSLHWMEWAVVLPRFRQLLLPGGYLALIFKDIMPPPWDIAIREIIGRYSTNKEYQPYDLLAELQSRGLFVKQGEKRTAPVWFRQSVDAYVESWHSRNGLSRDRMEPAAAAAFDEEVRSLITPFCPQGVIEAQLTGYIVWGR